LTNYNLPYFGEIDLTELKEYYQTANEFDKAEVKLDLNFENKNIDQRKAQLIETFLDSIDRFDKQNKVLINDDYEKEGESFDYINFYLDEFDENEISKIVDNRDENISPAIQLLSKLRLIRVGLYPDGKYGADYFGVFDYSIYIDGEPCNQLLVIKTNKNGNLDHITWES
jgi:hypothetical protein